MAESSFPWDGTTVGDATIAEYSSKEFIEDWLQLVLVYDRTRQGVIDTNYAGLTGGLIVAAGAGVVTVQTGAAIVDGRLYKNTAVVTLTPDNTASTRVDRVVLRRDVAAQTVRLAILKGTDGVGTPTALTQNATTWEISLAQFALTPGPTIGTVTNEIEAVRTPLGPGYQEGTLPTQDAAHSAGAWNSLGAGVTITLGPGKWKIIGIIIGTAQGAGNIAARIRNNTAGTTHGESFMTIKNAGDRFTMHLTGIVVNLSAITQYELQYFAINAADAIEGNDAGRPSGLFAFRIV